MLPGCSAISALNDASSSLPTYDLRPVQGATEGPRLSSTFVIAMPVTPAVLETDRLLIRPEPAQITYLPDVRWSEELPSLVQSLIVRSLSSTGRVGYVGPAGEGPIPDFAILSRIDAFDVSVVAMPEGGEEYRLAVDLHLTIVRDANQRVVSTRTFQGAAVAYDLDSASIVAAYQGILDTLLVNLTTWIIGSAR